VLSQVVELSMHALQEDLRAGLTREQAFPSPPPRPPPPAPAPVTASPPSAPRLALHAGSFYSLSAHSAQVPVTHGPGLLLALGWSGPRGALALATRGRYELPQTHDDPRIGLRFATLALRVDAEAFATLGAGSAGFVGLNLGLGPDLVWLWPRTSHATEGWEPAAHRLSSALVLCGGVSGGVRLGARASVFLEVSAEFDPAKVHYDIDVDGARETVVTRFRVRPVGALGVRVW